MKEYSAFDILGPVMIGPSSSHTAGAARLGKIAGIIAGGKDNIDEVKFILHGSFAKTYRGHGTDKALVAGILGMNPWDEMLRNSMEMAEKLNLKISFVAGDLGDVHPNTVKFIIHKKDKSIMEITGSSIGGGSIKIIEINNQNMDFSGDYPTLIVYHKDIPGMISKISTMLYDNNINIAFLKVYRSIKGSSASMIFETDNIIPEWLIDAVKKIENVRDVIFIKPIMESE
ncbi:L-serine ammonia-lyase, iron-sulfur-dependent subunit beta [Clostridium neuense]|uniref:L-serine deaminase n=1 Tax=Clostridium neuense TaxID=1728934 RepID=A0ABW8TFJ4_9CLOT